MNTTDAFDREWDPERIDKALDQLIRYAKASRDAFIMGEFSEGDRQLTYAQITLTTAIALVERARLMKDFRGSATAEGPPADGGK